MGNRWQAMFAIREVASILVITAMYAAGVSPDLLWRIALALGAVPAFVLLVLRLDIPETTIWLIQKGRFHEAKRVTRELYGDLFPSFFNAIGPANATFVTAVFPFVGLLAAIMILPEVYGFVEVRHPGDGVPVSASSGGRTFANMASSSRS